MLTPDQQYINLCTKILDFGTWVRNKRTGKNVLTAINADMEYDCSNSVLPILTTKKIYYKSAIAEMLGYLRGYSNAADFRKLGTKTWDANANVEAWQKSPCCGGKDDMGYCYGAVGSRFEQSIEDWRIHTQFDDPGRFNQWLPIIEDLSNGIDNRREIVTFYHPGTLHRACLSPCMHTHTFSILNGTLYLTSYQRSADVPLGVPFNMIQAAWLLIIMAKVTGLKPGIAYHKMVNVHIYEDQVENIEKQIMRTPMEHPTLHINPNIKTFEDLLNEDTTLSDFTITNYESHPPIKFPFSV